LLYTPGLGGSSGGGVSAVFQLSPGRRPSVSTTWMPLPALESPCSLFSATGVLAAGSLGVSNSRTERVSRSATDFPVSCASSVSAIDQSAGVSSPSRRKVSALPSICGSGSGSLPFFALPGTYSTPSGSISTARALRTGTPVPFSASW